MSKNFHFLFFIFQFLSLAILLGIFVLSANSSKAFEVRASQIQSLDPSFTLNALNIDRQWGLAAAQFPKAWEKSVGSTSTVVAIIDTGIDETHEDLSGQSFTLGFDFVKNQPILKGSNSDDNGHGTLVSSIIGAVANNNKGIVGTNWFVTLMPVKALDDSGRGDSATVAKAIIWSTDNGANIINLSLGGRGFEHDAELSKAIAYAFNHGAVIVASAGNDEADGAKNLDLNPVFPVCNDNNQNMVIGVTALDEHNIKPDFANFGKSCIDVAAPGRRILAAINLDPLTKIPSPSGYAYVSGTSMAAAFVTGEAALIKSLYPYASGSQIRDRIISTAKAVDFLNLAQCDGRSCNTLLGSGLIDASAAVSQDFPLPVISENELVRAEGHTEIYWIAGGQKRPVGISVFNRRFLNSNVRNIPYDFLQKISTGPYATPEEGTLVKTASLPTVYQISHGLKLPITYQVFKQRDLNFSQVLIVDTIEMDSWVTGKFLAPKEGTLVKTANSSQLYWVVDGILHKINQNFYNDRGLKIFPILTVTQKDIMSYNIGEAYLR